jgi:hypothetical protein
MHRQSQSDHKAVKSTKTSHQAVTMGAQHQPIALNQGVSAAAGVSDPQAPAGAFGTS